MQDLNPQPSCHSLVTFTPELLTGQYISWTPWPSWSDNGLQYHYISLHLCSYTDLTLTLTKGDQPQLANIHCNAVVGYCSCKIMTNNTKCIWKKTQICKFMYHIIESFCNLIPFVERISIFVHICSNFLGHWWDQIIYYKLNTAYRNELTFRTKPLLVSIILTTF